MTDLYSRYIPGANGGDQLLAFANLIDPAAPIDLRLELLQCGKSACEPVKDWTFTSLTEIIEANPLFSITSY